ncbi:hypothetical protein OH492_12875 [Vibrio chagasii]|nr:hypothetical protein [Vibrio chagasii]
MLVKIIQHRGFCYLRRVLDLEHVTPDATVREVSGIEKLAK